MEKFFAAVRNIFAVPELRKRIGFTLGMLFLYRIGAHITAPGVNREQLQRVWNEVGYTLLGVLDLFSGGNFSTISIFALGVTPYITASIILQLMTVVYPALKKIQEEGEMGRQKINQWTRYLTVILALIQTTFVAFWLQNNGVAISPGTVTFIIPLAITLTTGTIFVMWLGEQITERGVGNGISLLIFAGIVIGLPNGVQQVAARVSQRPPKILMTTAAAITPPPMNAAFSGISPTNSQGHSGLMTASSMTMRDSVTAGTDLAPLA